MDRRQAVLRTLLGAGGLGLRAFAAGVPLSLLLRPNPVGAATQGRAAPQLQRLVLASSSSGDPLNANVPGTYDDPRLVHGAQASMAATPVVQRGVARVGAACWARLPRPLLDRTAFLHHATHNVVHGERSHTLGLGGAVAAGDSFVGWLAGALAAPLQTQQVRPICVGVTDAAGPLCGVFAAKDQLSATALAAALGKGGGNGPLQNLAKLRTETLAWLRTAAERPKGKGSGRVLEDLVPTAAEQRHRAEQLQQLVAEIHGDAVEDQARAVAVLMALNVAPVVSLHLDFGGDNHGDNGLAQEARAHGRSVAVLAQLYGHLHSMGLADHVSLLALNGFGRTLAAAHRGADGRDHNGHHNVAVLMGANVAGGVVGGVAPLGRDFAATAIDSHTGAAAPTGGDVRLAESLASVGKTTARALGLGYAATEAGIAGGRVLQAALLQG